MNTETLEEEKEVSRRVEIKQEAAIETQEVKTVKPNDAIYELCDKRRNKLLPFLNNNTMQFEKLARSFAWEINTNDKLRQCDQKSMIDAFYKCCEYGLDPASSLGQVWMIPYGGKLDFQIGYRGWLKLLWNNPKVTNAYSCPVYEDDEFSYKLGLNQDIEHKPAINGDRSLDKLIATYGVVKLKNGEAQIKVCYRDEIDQSKSSSRGGSSSSSPWHKYFEAMALVVPIRKMAKNLGLTMRADDFDEGAYEVNNIKEVA
jgi:recombination protein RecT